jgi:hypothetical protein
MRTDLRHLRPNLAVIIGDGAALLDRIGRIRSCPAETPCHVCPLWACPDHAWKRLCGDRIQTLLTAPSGHSTSETSAISVTRAIMTDRRSTNNDACSKAHAGRPGKSAAMVESNAVHCISPFAIWRREPRNSAD